jgi:hypothetical protein
MINYNIPSGGGSINNLKYIVNDVSNENFSNLFTSPVVLIPAVANKIIFPVAVSIQYDNVVATGSGYAIGPKSLLLSYGTVAFGPMYVLGSNINGNSGTLFIGNNYSSGFPTNGAQNTPIVFFDDTLGGTVFNTFIFTALYLEI